MAQHNELGILGENLAATYLRAHQYTILFRNWRHSFHEIDLIAMKAGKLHFVEVKLRTSKAFGFPELQVSKKKFKYLTQAAEAFLQLHPQYQQVQFDILSINITKGKPVEYFLIEDVFL